jgi:hypothetical protein
MLGLAGAPNALQHDASSAACIPATGKSDASLLKLSTSWGELQPTFFATQLSYTVRVDDVTAAIAVTVVPTAPSVCSMALSSANTSMPLAKGEPSEPVKLAYGESSLTVTVLAADNSTASKYQLLVTRPRPDATRKCLALAGAASPKVGRGRIAALDVRSMRCRYL